MKRNFVDISNLPQRSQLSDCPGNKKKSTEFDYQLSTTGPLQLNSRYTSASSSQSILASTLGISGESGFHSTRSDGKDSEALENTNDMDKLSAEQLFNFNEMKKAFFKVKIYNFITSFHILSLHVQYLVN